MRVSLKRNFYEKHLQAWEISGLNQKRYCDQENLSYSAFKAWRAKLNQQSPPNPAFVEATYTPSNDPGPILQIGLPNGVRMSLNSNTSPDMMKKILQFIGEIKCSA